MWTKLAIIAMLIVLFICTVYFSSSKRKEKLFMQNKGNMKFKIKKIKIYVLKF